MTYTRKLKTHCIRGHERTPENVNTDNSCRECRRIKCREYNRRRRGAKPAREIERIRDAHTLAGAIHYIQRRRARGIPPQGKAA